MDSKLYKELKEDLAWSTGEKLVNNCHRVSHAPDSFIAVFWYNLSTRELVLSTDFNVNHNNAEIYRDDSKEPWIKGRVFNCKNLQYVCLYWRHDKKVTKESIRELIALLTRKLNVDIYHVVDYDGVEID